MATVVDMLELHDVVHHRISDLLVDQIKRTAVGVELMARPSILFLDEPTTGAACPILHHLLNGSLDAMYLKLMDSNICCG